MLASGSGGNCSLLHALTGAMVMIDAGIAPRRVRDLIREDGFDLDTLDAVVLTHLDADHFVPTWTRALPDRTRVYLHPAHAREARRVGLATPRIEIVSGAFEPAPGIRAGVALADHDVLGSAAYRFELSANASLGYATDVGRPTRSLAAFLSGVGVLAVESNYCPGLQEASSRPEVLKSRIMGGRGHLSNAQCARLVAHCGSPAHVVLLHLSRECNTPTLAAAPHAGRPYALTIAAQHEPTGWITLAPGANAPSSPGSTPPRLDRRAPTLFDHLAPAQKSSA